MRKSFLLLLILLTVVAAKPKKVVFLPFEDKVRMVETWNLGVDIPRWYSVTVDTIGLTDTLISTVPFDSVLSFLKQNQWTSSDYKDSRVLTRIAGAFKADYVVTGIVKKFSVVKRAINSDGDLAVTHSVSTGASGAGNSSVMGGIQSFSASVIVSVDIFEPGKPKPIARLDQNSEKRDGGLKIWLPVQGVSENEEWNFDHLSSTPFGSVYFHRSVVGYLMKTFSLQLSDKLATLSPLPVTQNAVIDSVNMEYLEGKILERTGSDVYLNLGSEDKLYKGQFFEALKPDHPIKNEKGDTLGWVEVPAGELKIRSIKSTHFSLAAIISEKDSVKTGWTVRTSATSSK